MNLLNYCLSIPYESIDALFIDKGGYGGSWVGHAYRFIARAYPKYIAICCNANQINIKLFEKRCTPDEILEINCLIEIEVVDRS